MLRALLASFMMAVAVTMAAADEPTAITAASSEAKTFNTTASGKATVPPDVDSAAIEEFESKAVNILRYRLVRLRRTHEKLLRDRSVGKERINEVHDQMVQAKKELVEYLSGEKKPDARLAQRLEHLKLAAQHLTKAGFSGMAKQVRQHADEIARGESDPRLDPETDAKMQPSRRQFDGLGREVASTR